LIKKLREKNKNIILLDGGDSISAGKDRPERRAEASMQALDLMCYDGLNIADGELGLGLNFFEKLREKTGFPLLSANLYKNEKPLGQIFFIKKFAGFNVGVIGLVSPSYFNSEVLAKENLEVKNPETALKEILPKVRDQADIVILLSHLGKKETALLLQNVPGVDVAIIGHDQAILNQPELLAKTILVQNSTQGKFLGILDLTIGTTGTIKNYTGSMVSITEDTSSDPTVLPLLREFEKKKPNVGPTTKENLPQ